MEMWRTIGSQNDTYKKHVENLQGRRFTFGYDALDRRIRGIGPGDTLFVLGASGGGKSMLLQNMLLHGGREIGTTLFLSLEMPASRVWERTAQIALQIPGYAVEEKYENGKDLSNDEKNKIKAFGADNMLVCEEGRLSLEKIETYIEIAKAYLEKNGLPEICAVGIDYLGLIKGPTASSVTESISMVAKAVKDLAKAQNVPIIVLAQVNRESSKSGEITLHSGKDSSEIENSGDFVISINKTKIKGRDDFYWIKILKNRNGLEGARFHVDMSRTSMRVHNITEIKSEEQLQQEKEERQTKKEEDGKAAAAGDTSDMDAVDYLADLFKGEIVEEIPVPSDQEMFPVPDEEGDD